MAVCISKTSYLNGEVYSTEAERVLDNVLDYDWNKLKAEAILRTAIIFTVWEFICLIMPRLHILLLTNV